MGAMIMKVVSSDGKVIYSDISEAAAEDICDQLNLANKIDGLTYSVEPDEDE